MTVKGLIMYLLDCKQDSEIVVCCMDSNNEELEKSACEVLDTGGKVIIR